mmetsp:Transcript_35680/g.83563  ORF Transcript_35680/g.83563 Transcript_35680/m.83563 type:complete len:93 (+) Transcript_35680:29-307(+)
MVFQTVRAFQTLTNVVNGITVPEQGFNVFSSVTMDACAPPGGDDAAPGNIYCLGKYTDGGPNDANAAASYTGREWKNLAPTDPSAPGASPAS